MIEMNIHKLNLYELQNYIVENWEQHWDDDARYFIILENGEAIEYDLQSKSFYLNSFCNPISHDEVIFLLSYATQL